MGGVAMRKVFLFGVWFLFLSMVSYAFTDFESVSQGQNVEDINYYNEDGVRRNQRLPLKQLQEERAKLNQLAYEIDQQINFFIDDYGLENDMFYANTNSMILLGKKNLRLRENLKSLDNEYERIQGMYRQRQNKKMRLREDVRLSLKSLKDEYPEFNAGIKDKNIDKLRTMLLYEIDRIQGRMGFYDIKGGQTGKKFVVMNERYRTLWEEKDQMQVDIIVGKKKVDDLKAEIKELAHSNYDILDQLDKRIQGMNERKQFLNDYLEKIKRRSQKLSRMDDFGIKKEILQNNIAVVKQQNIYLKQKMMFKKKRRD